jgi:hypothetical protein
MMISSFANKSCRISSLYTRRRAASSCQSRFFSEGGDQSDRIHSTDIAFKPNASGWGGSKKYESRWNDIFGKKKDDMKREEEAPTAHTKAK